MLILGQSAYLVQAVVLVDFPRGSAVKNPSALQETWEMQVQSLDQEDPLEEDMATHSYSCLGYPMGEGAWRAAVQGVTKSWTKRT